ncbi:MAG: ferrous iron transport protein B [Geobacteraceae bacterium]|nr:ferrous iron transport protein B [Geobacteraceae bacterium]
MNKHYLAFAGNPNAGKTTLFNAITGAHQHVGNYPGITVDRKEGSTTLEDSRIDIVDLPGCYSLTAYTQEELVARQVLVDERPGLVVNVVDATKLERHLYLTMQFLELGVPVMLALNMMDDVRSKGIQINVPQLQKDLGCPAVGTVARTGAGKEELLRTAVDYAQQRNGEWRPLEISYGPDIDPLMDRLGARIEETGLLHEKYPPRWVALKYTEGDDSIIEQGRSINPLLSEQMEADVQTLRDHCLKTLNTFPEAIIADYRYGFIHALLKKSVIATQPQSARLDLTDKLDQVLTHKLGGPVLMLALLYAMFHVTFTLGEYPMELTHNFFALLADGAAAILPDGVFQSLIVSGIIDGVGGVLGFVPLIMIMFIIIAFLEDSGYMARMAYMLDKVFRSFGLHGSSVMPFIISGGIAGGCAVPGVMAARTLRSPKEKLATIITAPFMPCGAKIPVFLLLIGAFFSEHRAAVMFSITLGAWVMALLVARVLRSTLIRGESTPFVMELPPYRLPTIQGVLIHMWERTWEYIKKAGTVVLAISILIWAAMTFPGLDQETEQKFAAQQVALEQQLEATSSQTRQEQLQMQLEKLERKQGLTALKNSIAGRLGQMLEPISELAGFNWRTNIALIGGVAAKEVIVSTLGTAYSLGDVDADNSESLMSRMQKDEDWNRATAISAIIFVLLYAPCFVTIVVMARESSWGWAMFALVFNTALAFGLACAAYQIATAMV